ncbi:MAG: serine protease [bacterium (Candidatus Ratteibacteria) CG23_combo_of_CG06-09_8_20_14_all_48_7]|uniref:Serine protease n=1 Tax=bacterium (Candidatus Ratteibacteria) CG23_combo_of_CG06-09_8_20_14_all_48_7 TaxID=2014292 RepID=A0A2G9YAN9_9BACT|nr:MAG: serine protease [bacterium (Candidatus Ratteibacteria) CG23_combo_of_CG06-09_8_20_14_all_48_7]
MHIKREFWGLLFFFLTVGSFTSAESNKIIVVPLKGAVSPATAETILGSLAEAKRTGATALVIKIDTPGGLLTSTREIVQGILNSPVPVIAYVAPAGAQCASAGTFIALACPVLAMAPGTNIGAAHPVSPMGKLDETMEKKVVNDTVSYITTLAVQWNRNKEWAEKAVRESVSINEHQALRLKVADLTAENLNDLLTKIDGKILRLPSGVITLKTKGVPVEEIIPNLRHRILQSVSDPNIAYLLLLFGILGIWAEFSTPGIGFPGIVGFICLLLAFYGLSALPVNIAGVALIFIAVGFFVLEAHTPMFGLLGLGGIVALLFGSLFLIRPYSYLRVSRISYVAASLVFALLIFAIATFAFKSQRRKVTTGKEGLLGEIGEARTDLAPEGTVYVHGEYWTARSLDNSPIKQGEKVKVEKISGRTLLVTRCRE